MAGGNGGRWRRMHAPTDKETAARRPETQDAVVGMRDANGRTLLDALQNALQGKFFTVCTQAPLRVYPACVFRGLSDANLRTVNRLSQLRVACAEERGGRSLSQKRNEL